ARRYVLAMRVHEPSKAPSLVRMGHPAVDRGVLDSHRLHPSEKQARCVEILRDLASGLSEWVVPPRLGNDEYLTLESRTWQARRANYDFLMSDRAREVIEQEGITLLDYRSLRDAWSRRPASDA
ncbi:MAG TPA: hypothetical protein VD789_06020, partial [Thermomicrobiales bacterium]|nr:hypothetical protein [Thermomicrobiales bacterium]